MTVNPQSLWESHVRTAEPLTLQEVEAVIAAGLTKADEWDNRGGGLYWHQPTWPDDEEKDAAEPIR